MTSDVSAVFNDDQCLWSAIFFRDVKGWFISVLISGHEVRTRCNALLPILWVVVLFGNYLRKYAISIILSNSDFLFSNLRFYGSHNPRTINYFHCSTRNEVLNSEMSCTWFISTCCCYAQRHADVARSKQRLYLHSYQIWTWTKIRK